MKRLLPATALAALLALAACNNSKKPEVVDANPDPMANALAAAPKVELPPAIAAEKSLRCKDNSLVYVTFFQGDKQVVVHNKDGSSPTKLVAAKAGDPYVADGGWKLSGTSDSVTLTQPGKGERSCKS